MQIQTPALGPRYKLSSTAYAIAYVSNELETMAGGPDEADYDWADARVMVGVLLDDEFGDVECGPNVDREAVVRGVEAFLDRQRGPLFDFEGDEGRDAFFFSQSFF